MEQCIKIKTETFAELVDEINTLDSKNILDWSFLSNNINSEIDLELFYSVYKKKIDWVALSKNTIANFTEAFLIKYKDSLQWGGTRIGSYAKYGSYELGGFSYNTAFPMRITFIEKVIEYIDWRSLGMNPSLKVFDPEKVYGPECSINDYYNQIPIFDILIKYWDKWEKEGSFFIADIYQGHSKDSIYDNPNIDWDFFNEHKSTYSEWADYKN